MARTYRLTVGTGEAGMRLDHYLVRRLPRSVSRAMIQRTIASGVITVGEGPVKAHHKVRRGERITATFAQLPAAPRDAMLIPQDIPLEVVYEDAALLVVNKPPGLVTHPAPGHWDGTLVNAVLWHLQHNAQGSGLRVRKNVPQPPAPRPEPGLPRAGIVHRLDKDTSGLLVVAKTEAAHHLLAKQLKARTLSRRYLAIVEGHVPLRRGRINAAIGRHQTRRKEMSIQHLQGRQAITNYRVLKHLERPGDVALRYSVVEVSLETGRTHQIRLHMAHLGYPVIGDVTYGKRSSRFWAQRGVSRQLLHAYRIRFVHPTRQQSVELSAPVPTDLASWIPAGVLPSEQGRPMLDASEA